MPKCRDCLYWEVCHEYQKAYWGHKAQYSSPIVNAFADSCIFYKDRSRFVELPWHTGEKVWVTYSGKEEKGEVIGFYITASLYVCTHVILEDGNTFTGVYGKNVFPRKEKFEECKSYG